MKGISSLITGTSLSQGLCSHLICIQLKKINYKSNYKMRKHVHPFWFLIITNKKNQNLQTDSCSSLMLKLFCCHWKLCWVSYLISSNQQYTFKCGETEWF